MPQTTPISAGELAQFQADLVTLMDQSIEIQRKGALAQGATGAVTSGWAHLSNVVGTLSQPSQSQLANYDYLVGALAAWQVRLPVGTDVKATDHLLVGGQTLEVQIVLQPQSYQGAIRVLATEIKEQ